MVAEMWSETDRIFCHFGPFFVLLPPLPPNNPETQKFEKKIEKNPWRYYPFIHTLCTINEDHIYGF